jgi:hypothetical protein
MLNTFCNLHSKLDSQSRWYQPEIMNVGTSFLDEDEGFY